MKLKAAMLLGEKMLVIQPLKWIQNWRRRRRRNAPKWQSTGYIIPDDCDWIQIFHTHGGDVQADLVQSEAVLQLPSVQIDKPATTQQYLTCPDGLMLSRVDRQLVFASKQEESIDVIPVK